MKAEQGRKIRFWYGVATSVLTIVVGVLFIVQLLRIYYSGPDKPYSYDLVSLRLKEILVPIIVWFCCVLGAIPVWACFPETVKIKATVDEKQTLEKLKGRLPSGTPMDKLQKYEKSRKIGRLICLGVCVVCAVCACVYLFDFSHFPASDGGANVTDEVVKMVGAVLPWVLGCLLACIALSVYEATSVRKETAIVKKVIAETARKGIVQKPQKSTEKDEKRHFFQTEKGLAVIRIAVLACAVAFIVVGVCNGGMKDVFAKAIKICTECIGLG